MIASARDTHDAWEAEIPSELQFWRHWLQTRGDRWPADFESRMDPGTPLGGWPAEEIGALPGDELRILDVGAGPITSLGKTLPGKRLRIEACDPLADGYDRLLGEAGVEPPVRTVACDGERLLERWAPETFDVTHARNAIDHAYDPFAAIVGMLGLVRPGGIVCLGHETNEAVRERFAGLHQWNFDADADGHFLVWNAAGVVDVTDRLAPLGHVRCMVRDGGGWIDVVIERRADSGGLDPDAIAAAAGLREGFDRRLLELLVVDRGDDRLASATFRAALDVYAPGDDVAVTFVPGPEALAALVPAVRERAQYAAFLDVHDTLAAPLRAAAATAELALDRALRACAVGGGRAPAGLRGRLVRTRDAAALVAGTPFEAPAAAASARPRAICVLGFHRSGTSMTARLLNLLGVDLGPEEDLVGAVAGDNPRGYWEPAWVVAINDAVLAAFGGSDLEPPVLAPGWERDPRLDDLRRRAGALLDDKLAGTAVWGFKDPRTALTLPFWQALLAERAAEVRYVICLRSPVETAASMLRRDYDPQPTVGRWSELWLAYTASALAATQGARRRIVVYEDLLGNGLAEVDALADLAGVPRPVGAARDSVRAEIDAGLRHHASGLCETAGDERLPAAVRSCYVTLVAAARARREDEGSELAAALELSAVAAG